VANLGRVADLYTCNAADFAGLDTLVDIVEV
jgi:hypothetical protein